VIGTEGGKKLSGVKLAPFSAASALSPGSARDIGADCLIVSGGWSPTIHLASQAGARPVWSDDLQAFLPPETGNGWIGAAHSMALFRRPKPSRKVSPPGARQRVSRRSTPAPRPTSNQPRSIPIPRRSSRSGRKANPLSISSTTSSDDVRLAHLEGFVSVEHLKRYTTLGMATDQGKGSNVPGLAIMAEVLGQADPRGRHNPLPSALAPVSVGALAAERFGDLKPERLTPMHDWHLENGATM
jgi:hypothetical protein